MIQATILFLAWHQAHAYPAEGGADTTAAAGSFAAGGAPYESAGGGVGIGGGLGSLTQAQAINFF